MLVADFRPWDGQYPGSLSSRHMSELMKESEEWPIGRPGARAETGEKFPPHILHFLACWKGTVPRGVVESKSGKRYPKPGSSLLLRASRRREVRLAPGSGMTNPRSWSP